MNLLENLNSKDKRHLAASSTFYFLEEMCTVFMTIFILDMLNLAITGTGYFDHLHHYWICLAAILIIKTFSNGKAELEKHYAGYSITERIRTEMVLKLKKFSLGFYSKERLGEIESIIHKDVDTVDLVAAHVWSRMFGEFALTIIIGAGLAFLNIKMFLAMVFLLPVGVYFLFSGLKENIKKEEANKTEMMNMVSLFVEYAQGLPVLKAFNRSSLFEDKLKHSTKKFRTKSIKSTTNEALVLCKYALCLDLSFVFLALTGGILLYQHQVTVIEFLLFMMISKEFYKSFTQLEAYFLYHIRLEGSFRRIKKILYGDVMEEILTPVVPESFDIKFDHTCFKYNEGFELNDINLEVKQGELVALTGHSGSGKTTLTNLILRFYDPNSGSITIGRTDIRKIDYDTLLKNISIVMQNVILFSDTISNNIKMGNKHATKEDVIAAAHKAEIHDFIISLPKGYDTVLDENGCNLSGGQKQRISVARALIKDAPIVILDEATSNVDPINERKIQKAISALAKGRTVLVIAHHLKTIRNADKIVVFDSGKVVEQGKFKELIMRNGLFSQLWNSQDKVGKRLLGTDSQILN
jgi:ATP-binding cassette subfamily B protein